MAATEPTESHKQTTAKNMLVRWQLRDQDVCLTPFLLICVFVQLAHSPFIALCKFSKQLCVNW